MCEDISANDGMPVLPTPPTLEGYLKKLKRKTSNFNASWNKRWFFVDEKRREFGYCNTKSPAAAKCSIYLNDITAVIRFDDTHFQLESRNRNFFLCGESKAATSVWVDGLNNYRKQMIEYEKERARVLVKINTPAVAKCDSNAEKIKTSSTKRSKIKGSKQKGRPEKQSSNSSTSSGSFLIMSDLKSKDEVDELTHAVLKNQNSHKSHNDTSNVVESFTGNGSKANSKKNNHGVPSKGRIIQAWAD